ncbi:hypothetical protein cand_020050 [Cryptosporidium andersoni]|uniref:MPN domain-containing protein n=1 Tax=Cryptosporidium andersoni TaxID=117008 RepID=A0A1J4MTA2_9CRYT|nr:hypothetical protein cand_020050 [Cryptosporidium andersoni]
MEVSLSEKAFGKMAMHSLKYPKCPVDGILLGYEEDQVIKVIDVIPLFHSPRLYESITLALLFVEEYCIETVQKGLLNKFQLIGYYYDEEFNQLQGALNTESQVDTRCSLILEKILQNNDAAVFVRMKRDQLFTRDCLTVSKMKSKQQFENVSLSVCSNSPNILRAVKDMQYFHLYDFEDHLLNPNLNWFNPNIFK